MKKTVFTSAGGSARTDMSACKRKMAFTLAEVLITLGIIGIVAAMTFPALLAKYQKNVTVTRLEKVYSLISQALLFSVKDNEDIKYWDFELTSAEFMEKYISPYFHSLVKIKKSSDTARNSKIYVLPDGTTFYGWMYKLTSSPSVHDITTFYRIHVDINGDKKPNQAGRDQFTFYIFPKKLSGYNTGNGNCAKNVPGPGLYPDGYGYDRDILLNDGWRGCNKKSTDLNPNGGTSHAAGSFCTALIMLDGWKISDDYDW